MLKRKIASGSERLYEFSDYRLNKMWLNGEINKCPKCKRYHDKKEEVEKEKEFLYNLILCDFCQKTQDILDNWLSNKENNK